MSEHWRRSRELLAAAFAAGGAPPGRLRAVTVPAPVVPLDAWWEAASRPVGADGGGPAEDGLRGVFFLPPAGLGMAAVGVSWQAAVAGEDRLAALRAAAAALWPQLDVRAPHGDSGPAAPAPRLLGGLAFAPAGSRPTAPWEDFGDGRFVLPRWCYYSDGAHGYVQVTLGPSAESRLDAELAALGAVFAQAAARGQRGSVRGGAQARLTQIGAGAWAAHVRAILQVIERGEYEKIVAARRSLVELSRPIADTQVLAELLTGQPECTAYAFRCGGATFLGATPERLIARGGDEVYTEALAGTVGRGGDTRAGQTLLRSGKDLAEHDLVVREILAGLAPHCDDLWSAPSPGLRRLRYVLHLHTPVQGHLRDGAHVLELVAALHPTPAVGGTPRRAAQGWIADHEPAWRGWYAGPVGWFDQRGDGEFMVALRCGLLEQQRAHLYVGAGIVRGSDPEREYHETALKQRALLTALKVEPVEPVESVEPAALSQAAAAGPARSLAR